jgi:hypothetical protein|tara:strand:- start:40 stop:501 length:462 start_codon:yes stop_codon:yes gene_type:complete
MEKIKSEITSVLRNCIIKRNYVDIFKIGIYIEDKIYSEVPIFLNLLETYFYDEEKFHGYLNSHYSTWKNIFQDNFIRMLLMYNKAYDFYRVKQIEKQAKRESEMIKMADEYNADKLIEGLEDMGLSPNISSLTKTLGRSRISKKRPSMKSKKK